MANFLNKTRKKLIIRELDPDTDLLKIFHYTQAYSKNFFLDSADNNEKTGRYSFIGYDPFLTVMSKGSNILTQKRHSITRKTGNPFDELRHLLSSFHLENGFGSVPFTCGAVGDFAYDLRANAEGVGRLMARCQQARAFLHCSSAAVYAYADGKPVAEDAPLVAGLAVVRQDQDCMVAVSYLLAPGRHQLLGGPIDVGRGICVGLPDTAGVVGSNLSAPERCDSQ